MAAGLLMVFLTLFSPVLSKSTAEKPPCNGMVEYALHHYQSHTSLCSFIPSSVLSSEIQNQFLMKELNDITLSAAVACSENRFLFSAHYFGYSMMGFSSFSVGYGRLFANRFSLSLTFDYYLHYASSCKSVHSLAFSLSFYAKLNKKWGIGFSTNNPLGLKYGIIGKERLPVCYDVYTCYFINDKINLSLAVEKTLTDPLEISLGVMFYPVQRFTLAFNLSLHDVDVSLMARFRHFSFSFDNNYHYRLGYSPQIGIIYSFKPL